MSHLGHIERICYCNVSEGRTVLGESGEEVEGGGHLRRLSD